MWNETITEGEEATKLQNHSYSERAEHRILRIEEQNVNNNKENIADVHKNVTV